MLSSSGRSFVRHGAPRAGRAASAASATRSMSAARFASRGAPTASGATAAASIAVAAAAAAAVYCGHDDRRYTRAAARIPTSGDVVSIGSPTKEKATGILFPNLCNGMTIAGVGVRYKYGFVKVYAVGTYVDPTAMYAVKKGKAADIEKALLNPDYPRTIRIVMNRNLSIDKYTAAIVEALEPRMQGQELEKLEEFKNLNPPVDLIEGAEMEMTIRGDTLLYKNALGGVGSIKSRLFTTALCDVYYGNDAVSPTHKQSVLEGIPKL